MISEEQQPEQESPENPKLPEPAAPEKSKWASGPRLALLLFLFLATLLTGLYRNLQSRKALEADPPAPSFEPADKTVALTPAIIALRSREFQTGSIGESLFNYIENGAPDYTRMVLVFNHIDFAADTLRGLTPKQRAELDDLAAVLTAFPDLQVEIGTHSDQNRDILLAYTLSRREGEYIAQYLSAKGAAPQQVVIRAFGYEMPLTDNSSPEAKAQNRRVELLILQLPKLK